MESKKNSFLPNIVEDVFSVNNENISEASKLHYISVVTDNLKENNRKITRNSFLLISSFLLYVLLLSYGTSFDSISIQYITLKDSFILLNLIPVLFSFLFFKNIALWNNNINLIPIFEKLSLELYKIDSNSDTKNVIIPFSFVHHIINYQYSNSAVKKVFKIPITIGFLFLLFFPVFFEVYTIYQIIINNTFSFVPTACAFLTGIFCLGAIIQALNPDKLN